MKTTLIATLCAALAATSAIAQPAAVHPRLMFSAEDLVKLRAEVRNEPRRAMLQRLTADAEVGNWGAGPIQGDHDEAVAAHRCAFLYALTGDDNWARRSRAYVEKRITATNWANKRIKGLTLYCVGKSIALAYDWCHAAPSWDAAFRATVSKKLLEQAEVIYTSGGTEQNTNPASNWQGLRWSTAGLCYLATDEPYNAANLNNCYNRTVRYLNENLGASNRSSGWNCEGLGYTYYPMGNGVCPFAIAMQRRDPARDMRKAAPALQHTLWTTYAATIRTSTGLWRPDFGDDNPGTNAEGTMGFAFWFCPPELRPGLRWWYDRTVGTAGNRTYDNARFGTISSLLYYADVPEKDPMSIPAWKQLFADAGGNGMFTWRNQYRDETDMVAQLYVKLRGNRGHAGPDALSFRIIGMDTLFAVGGGRYGPKLGGVDAYVRSMNTLYPGDPDGPVRTSGESGRILGTPLIKDDGGGHLVSAINTNNVGTRNHRRWFVADYSAASGAAAVYVICDTSDDGKFWQLCTLEPNRIATQANTFAITGPTGGSMKGTVLYPAKPTFATGTRIRGSDAGKFKNNNFVHHQSEDGCHLVVLTVAKKGQPHPPVSATGTWGKTPNGTVVVGRFAVTIKGDEVSYPR